MIDDEYYNLKNIRALLNAGFSSDELRRLCYDVPEFRMVYEQIGSRDKTQIIDILMEHAERRLLFTPLLNWVSEQNPARYHLHQPYYNSSKSEEMPAAQSQKDEIEKSFSFFIEDGKVIEGERSTESFEGAKLIIKPGNVVILETETKILQGNKVAG